jgi:hypothetical protein
MSNVSADLILYNARVITLDQKQPVAELVAVKGNKILDVGGEESLGLFRGAGTRLIDCEGGTVVPGFNDAHCHPLSYAATLLYVDCSPALVKDVAGIQVGIRWRAERTPEGKWVRAAKYDEFRLVGKRHPNRWELDEAAPRNPVVLVHSSGSICVLNSPALSLLGINRETPDPPGGRIGRDPETGEPDGLIVGRNELVERGVPPLDEEELAEGVRLASLEFLSNGITSLQDTGWSNDLSHWQRFQRLKERGILPVRVAVLAGSDNLEEFKNSGLSTSSGDAQLRLGGVKIALDESTGCPHPPQEDLNDHALRAHKSGFQLALHVNDLYTLEAALAALDFVLQQVPRPGHRHRLEHCAVCPPGLLRRLGASGAMIVTQPPFLYHMGDRYLDEVSSAHLGWVYPAGSFLKRGLKVAASSDSPVAPCNPLVGIYAAVTRKTETGRTLSPWERISPLEALKMYSLWGAYASFEDGIKGSISSGKLADLVVLSGDPTRTDPEEIREIKAMLTVVDGRVVWER